MIKLSKNAKFAAKERNCHKMNEPKIILFENQLLNIFNL